MEIFEYRRGVKNRGVGIEKEHKTEFDRIMTLWHLKIEKL